MKPAYSYRLLIFLTASLLPGFVGCAPGVAVNNDAPALPSFEERPAVFELSDGPGRIGILAPEVFLYDVSAGGVFEFRDDWSAKASNIAARSTAITLKRKGYVPLILPDPGHRRDFFDLKSRLRYHSGAFQSDFFIEKKLAFGGVEDSIVFSIGRIVEQCDLYGVDAFLYVYGFEEKFSDGRRQFHSDSVAVAMGGETSEKITVLPERTFLAVILAERNGRVSWYNHVLAQDDNDMRNEEHSLRLIGALFE